MILDVCGYLFLLIIAILAIGKLRLIQIRLLHGDNNRGGPESTETAQDKR